MRDFNLIYTNCNIIIERYITLGLYIKLTRFLSQVPVAITLILCKQSALTTQLLSREVSIYPCIVAFLFRSEIFNNVSIEYSRHLTNIYPTMGYIYILKNLFNSAQIFHSFYSKSVFHTIICKTFMGKHIQVET